MRCGGNAPDVRVRGYTERCRYEATWAIAPMTPTYPVQGVIAYKDYVCDVHMQRMIASMLADGMRRVGAVILSRINPDGTIAVPLPEGKQIGR